VKEKYTNFKELFDNIHDGFAYHEIITDSNGEPIDYRYIDVNEAFCEMTGAKKTDIIGKRLKEIFPAIENDPFNWIEFYGKVALDKKSIRFEQYSKLFKKWFSISTYSPEKGYFITLFHDITAQKEAENHLRASEEKLRFIFENSRDAILWANPEEAKIVNVNKAAETLLEREREELIGQSISILHPPQAGKLYLDGFKNSVTKNDGKENRTEIITSSGKIIPVKISDTVLEIDGKQLIQGVIRDISAEIAIQDELRKAAEAAETASKAKSDFIANISHEIRTPMSSIIGMTSLMQKTKISDEQTKYMKQIEESANGLMEIITDILDFSEIEAGKVTIEKIPVDIEKIVEETVSGFMRKAKKNSINLEFDVSKDIPDGILGDPYRIKQVLYNLLGNSIKFTENGEVGVSVHFIDEFQEKIIVEFEVADTGVGIPQEKLSTILDSFVQGDSSATRKYGGTGLGLSIAKNIVEMMGGTISIQSEEGEGSVFSFTVVFSR